MDFLLVNMTGILDFHDIQVGRLDLENCLSTKKNSELKESRKKKLGRWLDYCISKYSILATESIFQRGEIMSFFPDRHEEHHTRTRSSVPFCPLQVFTAWVRTHAREKLRQSSRNMTSSWPPNKRHLFLTKLLRNEKFSPKQKNLSMFGALGGPNFLKIKGLPSSLSCLPKSFSKTRKWSTWLMLFLFFKKKSLRF